jgi:hypothetical protein
VRTPAGRPTQRIHDKTFGGNPRPFQRLPQWSSHLGAQRDRLAVEKVPLGSTSHIAYRRQPAATKRRPVMTVDAKLTYRRWFAVLCFADTGKLNAGPEDVHDQK